MGLVSLLIGVFLLCGCSTGTVVPIKSSDSLQSGSALIADSDPPAFVPILESASRALTPAMYTWRINGKLSQKLPESDSLVERNGLLARPTASAIVSLRTSRVPGRLRVIYYEHRFDPGRTDQASGVTADCGATSDVCRIRHAGDSQDVFYSPSIARNSTLVIQVDYPTFAEADTSAGIGAYSVAWVLDFVS